ncbi:hypothetical protein TBLA_0E03530 [Henningerozyma blattae CBS 6284]|uniref:Vps72/YL1 C-terminal domain-containing protein n=1 Tax=Henningerozyma blattae (strain ATCC 34711 / CBS 6284 / DSM 70876 / NBRC 10599 / NRRL Y-10934 / UCD 77-7) TaxID=1071380 RepID=I2H4V5_HENB6|nr:hypothetical protein TBLA_0E03530 [Tetrapisispora blattae CBS 6284]CCH61407.1 hypothetical protein TBLA_0E03530 [Tetrapisispora blattae CBS 6284]
MADDGWIMASRERRSNAGNRMKSLLAQEVKDMQSKTQHLNDDDIDLLFQEEENDEDFDLQNNDTDEYLESQPSNDKNLKTNNYIQQDLMLSESESEFDENANDDEAGEKELIRQEKLQSKKRKKKNTAPILVKRSKPTIRPTHNERGEDEDGTTTDTSTASVTSHHKSYQVMLNPETLLMKDRRTSKRSSVVANKLKVYEKLSKAETKRKLIQERIRKHKEKQKQHILTQQDRLRIAQETEQINLQTLNKYKEQEIIKKKSRIAMQQRQKVKFKPNELIETKLSTSWTVTPIMEINDKAYWDEFLKKRNKKKKKYPKRPTKKQLLAAAAAASAAKEKELSTAEDINKSISPNTIIHQTEIKSESPINSSSISIDNSMEHNKVLSSPPLSASSNTHEITSTEESNPLRSVDVTNTDSSLDNVNSREKSNNVNESEDKSMIIESTSNDNIQKNDSAQFVNPPEQSLMEKLHFATENTTINANTLSSIPKGGMSEQDKNLGTATKEITKDSTDKNVDTQHSTTIETTSNNSNIINSSSKEVPSSSPNSSASSNIVEDTNFEIKKDGNNNVTPSYVEKVNENVEPTKTEGIAETRNISSKPELKISTTLLENNLNLNTQFINQTDRPSSHSNDSVQNNSIEVTNTKLEETLISGNTLNTSLKSESTITTKQVSFLDEPEIKLIDQNTTPMELGVGLSPPQAGSDDNTTPTTPTTPININDPLLSDTPPTEPIDYAGPNQLVSKDFVILYNFNSGTFLENERETLFGKQWGGISKKRNNDVETILKINMDNMKNFGHIDSSIDNNKKSFLPDLTFLDDYPSFGEYDKKMVHNSGEETNKELNITIKTQPPTGVFLNNGTRKKCIISTKPCQYFDPKNGVPYSDVEAYKIIQQIMDPIGEDGTEENPNPMFQWFGFEEGGIYLNVNDEPAKGVPEGFN